MAKIVQKVLFTIAFILIIQLSIRIIIRELNVILKSFVLLDATQIWQTLVAIMQFNSEHWNS